MRLLTGQRTGRNKQGRKNERMRKEVDERQGPGK